MNKIDAAACKVLREQINAALAPLGVQHDLVVKAGSATYRQDGTGATLKVEILAKVDGQVVTKEAQTYKECHSWFGLPADGLGKTFKYGAQEYTITGLNTRRSKFPLIGTCGGKSYKLPLSALVLNDTHMD